MLPFPLIRSIVTLCGETAILCTNKAIRGGFAWPDRLELAMREAKTLDKNTLFRMQCDLGAVWTCERMLDNEADAVSRAAMLLAKPPNYSGETALIGGCKQGNVALVEILIRNSPNEQVLATTNHGITLCDKWPLAYKLLLGVNPAANESAEMRTYPSAIEIFDGDIHEKSPYPTVSVSITERFPDDCITPYPTCYKNDDLDDNVEYQENKEESAVDNEFVDNG
eukprot:gene29232-biopygen8532